MACSDCSGLVPNYELILLVFGGKVKYEGIRSSHLIVTAASPVRPALLHDGLCTVDLPRLAAVPCTDCALAQIIGLLVCGVLMKSISGVHGGSYFPEAPILSTGFLCENLPSVQAE